LSSKRRSEEDEDGGWKIEDGRTDFSAISSSIFHLPSSILVFAVLSDGVTMAA
jgi:hypothetical protein